jgi:hypothetical protein
VGVVSRAIAAIIGRRVSLPPPLLSVYPELAEVEFRRGGLPPRVAGWTLGGTGVRAVTLRRTVFLGPHASVEPELLLHELRHVEQFLESRTFPVRYVWEFFRHGYHSNRFEREARDYAARRLAAAKSAPSHQDV